MMNKKALLICGLLIIAARPSLAAEKNAMREALESCSKIESHATRLICYDDIARKNELLTDDSLQKTEQSLKENGFWEASKKQAASGEDSVYLKNKAITSVVSESGARYNPVLTIMCEHAETDVYIDWQQKVKVPPSQGLFLFNLNYQFDAEEKKNEDWELSTDRKALFSQDPVSFIKKMRQHKKLSFFIAPPGQPAQVVSYDLSGINNVISLLVKECYN